MNLLASLWHSLFSLIPVDLIATPTELRTECDLVQHGFPSMAPALEFDEGSLPRSLPVYTLGVAPSQDASDHTDHQHDV